MIRLLLIAAALLFLSGCVSNPGNYYSYEGSGDYYYEDAGADVIFDSSPYGYGLGYGGGLGYGFGGGYGGYAGFGYGFGGYYGGYGYPLGYGYSPIWWTPPTIIVVNSPSWRAGADDERARRVALSHRPDVAYPESAAWARRDRARSTGSRAALANWGARRGSGRAPTGVVSRPSTTVPQSSVVQPSRSAPPASRSYSRQSTGSSPMRSVPASRTSSREH